MLMIPASRAPMCANLITGSKAGIYIAMARQ
jgi:hypothetical protein